MTDSNLNPSVNGGSASSTSNVDASVGTLKLVSSRTHLGPAIRSQARSKPVSAAANKIRLNNDLKVGVRSATTEPKVAKSNNQSLEIRLRDGATPKDAFVLMEAWDRLFGNSPGTEDYVVKVVLLESARNQVYDSFGIKPEKGKRPELTEEQRVAYSEAVRPYSFDYFEVRLSFKQNGHKTVRSKTYRYLQAPDLARIKAKLISQAKVVIQDFLVN